MFRKKESQNLKSSYLRYFIEKYLESWNVNSYMGFPYFYVKIFFLLQVKVFWHLKIIIFFLWYWSLQLIIHYCFSENYLIGFVQLLNASGSRYTTFLMLSSNAHDFLYLVIPRIGKPKIIRWRWRKIKMIDKKSQSIFCFWYSLNKIFKSICEEQLSSNSFRLEKSNNMVLSKPLLQSFYITYFTVSNTVLNSKLQYYILLSVNDLFQFLIFMMFLERAEKNWNVQTFVRCFCTRCKEKIQVVRI